MANRPRGRGISQSQRRKKAWIAAKLATVTPGSGDSLFSTAIKLTTPIGTVSTAGGNYSASTFALVNDPSAVDGDETSTLPEESTILRIRGSMLFPANELGLVPNEMDVQHVIGFGVTDIRSLISGSFPLPATDADWDGWMFLRQSAVAPLDSEGTNLDVKAMRKIKTGDAFFVAAQAMNVAGGGFVAPASWAFDLRLLMLLP